MCALHHSPIATHLTWYVCVCVLCVCVVCYVCVLCCVSALSRSTYSSYEPELFPGLIYRMLSPKIVLLVGKHARYSIINNITFVIADVAIVLFDLFLFRY